ncbi:MAG: DUF3160 domain-containing protein [Candidatus Obscuribacterales bacterium]|nr:DUF3160 domain-containing protein [Candidatus Obscuribacterales bacterium]
MWAPARRLLVLLTISIVLNLLFSSGFSAVLAIDLENMVKEGIKQQLPTSNPSLQPAIKVERKSQKLEDLIPRQDIPYSFPPMIPLQGINIAGLGPKAILSLGEFYFVVKANSDALKMSELYKANRAASKANYVTIDCIIHPYLGFVNRIQAETIKHHLTPLVKQLLQAMLKVALSDYKQAEDPELRADIESNIAFIALPLKVLDSSFVIPALGRVPQMVQADYDALVFARSGPSAVFDRYEDFSVYRPQGFYRSSPELINFYRVKTWISRLSYPLNDVSYENGGVRGNNFRRSVLLYRCIDLGRIDGKPAFDSWMR